MKTALLCPGPSLASYTPGDHDLLAGVNRAVSVAPCDFWVFLDERPYHSAQCLGEPAIVTSGTMYRRLIRKQKLEPSRPFIDRDRLPPADQLRWGRFSSTNALVLLAALGATEIECFGVDMAGTLDWDQFSHAQDRRDAKRWQEEATLWQQMVDYLGQRGCLVHRSGVTCGA